MSTDLPLTGLVFFGESNQAALTDAGTNPPGPGNVQILRVQRPQVDRTGEYDFQPNGHYLYIAYPQFFGDAVVFQIGEFDVAFQTTKLNLTVGPTSLIDAPPASVLSSVAGGALAPTTYYIKQTYTTADGRETAASPESSLAVAANHLLSGASPPPIPGVTGYNVYAGTASGAETRQNPAPIPIGTPWTELTGGFIVGVGFVTPYYLYRSTNLLTVIPPDFIAVLLQSACQLVGTVPATSGSSSFAPPLPVPQILSILGPYKYIAVGGELNYALPLPAGVSLTANSFLMVFRNGVYQPDVSFGIPNTVVLPAPAVLNDDFRTIVFQH
jgi:hypothetical protein